MEKEETIIIFQECSNCYYNEAKEVPRENSSTQITDSNFLCMFCKQHPEVQKSHQLRLERMLMILPEANISSFPNVARLMYRVLMGKINEKETN